MTTKYEKTARFAKLRLFAERNKLFAAAAQPRTVQASGNIIFACEEVLDQFAIRTWPNNNLDEIKFPIAWRRRLAKAAIRITTVDKMRKELLPVCNLRFSSLNKWAGVLVSELIATVRVHALPPAPPPIEQGHDINREIPRPSAFDLQTSAPILPNGINEREIPGTIRVPVDKAPEITRLPAEQAPTCNQISASTSTFDRTTASTGPGGTNKAPETTQMPTEQAPRGNHTSASIEPEKINGAPEITQVPEREIDVPEDTFKDLGEPEDTFRNTGVPEHIFRETGMPEDTFRDNGGPEDTFKDTGGSENTFKDTGVPQNTSASAVNLNPSELFPFDQKPHLRRKYKISSKHETVIDFSLPNAGTMTYSSSFGSSFGSLFNNTEDGGTKSDSVLIIPTNRKKGVDNAQTNLVVTTGSTPMVSTNTERGEITPEGDTQQTGAASSSGLTIAARKFAEKEARKAVTEAKKVEAAAKRAEAATKKAETVEARRVEAAAKKMEAATKKAEVAARKALEKKTLKEEAAIKKVEERAVKNVEINIEKLQTAKRKAALLSKDGNAGKKQRSNEKNEGNKGLGKEKEEVTDDQLN